MCITKWHKDKKLNCFKIYTNYYSGSGLGFLLGSSESREIIIGDTLPGLCVCPNL